MITICNEWHYIAVVTTLRHLYDTRVVNEVFWVFVVPSSNQVDLEPLNNEIVSRKRKHFQHGSAESERLIR